MNRVADDLAEVRRLLATLSEHQGQLQRENTELRQQLAHSETARADLLAQTEHLLELLATSRQELRAAWNKS